MQAAPIVHAFSPCSHLKHALRQLIAGNELARRHTQMVLERCHHTALLCSSLTDANPHSIAPSKQCADYRIQGCSQIEVHFNKQAANDMIAHMCSDKAGIHRKLLQPVVKAYQLECCC